MCLAAMGGTVTATGGEVGVVASVIMGGAVVVDGVLLMAGEGKAGRDSAVSLGDGRTVEVEITLAVQSSAP